MKNGIHISLVVICDDDCTYAGENFMVKNGIPNIIRCFSCNGTAIVGRCTFQRLYDSCLTCATQVILTKTIKSKTEKNPSVYIPNTNGSELIVFADSLDKAHAFARRLSWNYERQKRKKVFVLGGKSIFEQFINIDWIDDIYIVQFYEEFSKDFGSIDVDRDWKTVDVIFNEKYDIVRLEKRDRPLREFDDPCDYNAVYIS